MKDYHKQQLTFALSTNHFQQGSRRKAVIVEPAQKFWTFLLQNYEMGVSECKTKNLVNLKSRS